MSTNTTWRSNLLLACGSLVLSLFVLEMGLRAFGFPKFQKAHSSPPQFHFLRDEESGAYFYVNKPSTTISFQYDSNPRGYFEPGNTVNHVTNSLGFRGSEFSPIRKSKSVRLVFIGDSFTFGEGVRFEDTFAEVTCRLLTGKLGPENWTVESCNLGVGGYNTVNELFLLKKIGLQCRPDAVVISFVLNDAEPELFEIDPVRGPVRRSRKEQIQEGLSDPTPPQTLLYKSRIAQGVWRYIYSRKLTQQTEAHYHHLFDRDAKGWAQSQEALREMAAICRRERIPFLVMLFPIFHKLDGDYPFRDIHRMVATAAESDGATVLDLLPTFQGTRATDLWVHPTDQHPNEKAHHMAAEQLADRLQSWPEFRDKISRSTVP